MENLTLRKAVELAIKTEQLGAEFYCEMAEKFSDFQDVKAIFTRLTKDEIIHEQQFKSLLKQVDDSAIEKATGQDYLRATAMFKVFIGDAFANRDLIPTPLAALTNALNLEKSTLIYYTAIEEVIGKQDILTEIINAEKEHIQALTKVILSDAKFRGMADPW